MQTSGEKTNHKNNNNNGREWRDHARRIDYERPVEITKFEKANTSRLNRTSSQTKKKQKKNCTKNFSGIYYP